MATVGWFEARSCWRVYYVVTVGSRKVRRAKYAKAKEEATALATQLGQVEQATRTGIATRQSIEEWITRGWLTEEDAGGAFTGYTESASMKRKREHRPTAYEEVLAAYGRQVAQVCKGGASGRNYSCNMSQARQVIAWLEKEWPSLPDLTTEAVRDKLLSMKGSYTESSVRHFLIKTNLLLDQAVELGMAPDNPARRVSMRRDLNLRLRPARERRTLTEGEIQQLLEASLRYPQYLNGGLPAVVRLGLYAGLRNEEMCWLKWECIDWDKRILTIQASVCELTGERWLPKDFEARRIDVKEACIDFLRREYERQRTAGLGSPFVLPAGTPNVADEGDRRKHVHPSTPTKSFAKMIHDEGMDEGITVYTLRHTYATMALRAGVDLRTLQKRMGHSDIKTTMGYLHFIEPEQHPMDALRY